MQKKYESLIKCQYVVLIMQLSSLYSIRSDRLCHYALQSLDLLLTSSMSDCHLLYPLYQVSFTH